LREAMNGIVPDVTRTRIQKTGWNAPAHRWFSGESLERLRDQVSSRSFRERGIYVVPELLRVIDEHERIVATGEVRENHMMLLWQVANLDTWLSSLETREPA
jgi:asparagine synthase (glutamine-hydrolysing)